MPSMALSAGLGTLWTIDQHSEKAENVEAFILVSTEGIKYLYLTRKCGDDFQSVQFGFLSKEEGTHKD